MILCLRMPSGTVPRVSPATRRSPTACGGVKVHFLCAIERRGIDAAREEEAVFVGEDVERVLQAVEDLAEDSGPEFDREHFAGEFDEVADAAARGVLEDLHVGGVAADAEDFGFELLVLREGCSRPRSS